MITSAHRLTVTKTLLAPVLLIQGWWVKRHIIKLPEPKLKHQGVIGTGFSLRLLLLGDSSAAGVGVDSPEASLLGQLLKNLTPHFQVSYRMLAKSGQTTRGMIEQLKRQEKLDCDVVITALGVNDVTAQVPVKQWLSQQQELFSLIKQKFSPKKIISGLPPVRDFPALPWPLNVYMGAYADLFNQAIIEFCENNDFVSFQSLREYPVEALAAIDGFHPGPKVYQLWAQYLAEDISNLVLE